MDITRGEWVEKELDVFISRQAQKNGKANARAYLWAERRYWRRRRMQTRAAWFAYFCRQAEAHRKLSESYEARAEALCQEGEA